MFGFGFVFAGLHINQPYLVSLHGFGVGFVLFASLGVFFVLRARVQRSGATIARLALIGLWGLPAPAIGYADLAYAIGKQRVLHTDLDGIIRQRWHYQGVIMTDDLVMGAIFQHNVCTAVVEALNAGVDLLLVAYDGSQFYSLFACATAALARRGLDLAVLRDSERRLQQSLPADRVKVGSAP